MTTTRTPSATSSSSDRSRLGPSPDRSGRFLIIGLGAIGQRHVRNLRALLGDDAEILAYRTRGLTHVLTDTLEVEDVHGLHERFDIRVFEDLDEALDARP